MKTKHTPGPWICDDYYNPGSSPEIRMNGIRIARMLPASGESPSESEQAANARLITAGPKMFAALEWASRSTHHPTCKIARNKGIYCNCHVAACQDAIALAKVQD